MSRESVTSLTIQHNWMHTTISTAVDIGNTSPSGADYLYQSVRGDARTVGDLTG